MENIGYEHTGPVYKEHHRSSLRNKPWVVSTFVLAFLVVLLLLGNLFNITGSVVSANKAGESILNFAISQGMDAEIVSVISEGSFYKVILSVEGNDIPVYVTKDGKYFTSSLVPLAEEENSNTNTNTNTQTTEVPKSEKPSVELFVMSHCPYGTQAEKGMLPVVELLGDKIDFNLRFVYYAMHPSAGEVEEQLREYCIQKEQESKLNDYLTCFLEAGDGASCLTEAKIDKTKLNLCVSKADKEFQVSENKNDRTKWLSGNYPLFNVDKALNEQYKIGGSPTLVINGVQANSARDPSSYLDAVCQAFSDGNVPEECGEQLSTTAYVPMWGWTTASGSTTAAQCG